MTMERELYLKLLHIKTETEIDAMLANLDRDTLAAILRRFVLAFGDGGVRE